MIDYLDVGDEIYANKEPTNWTVYFNKEKQLYAIDYTEKKTSIWMSASTLHGLVKVLNDSDYDWSVRNRNMNNDNIVTFDAKKYEWKEIEGQGKCLVPIKEEVIKPNPFKGAKHGDRFKYIHNGSIAIMVILKMSDVSTYFLASESFFTKPSCGITGSTWWNLCGNSEDDLMEKINNVFSKNSKFVQNSFNKVG